MRQVKGLSALVLLAVALGPTSARADDASRADAAFNDGRRLLASGQTAAACAKFEESQRLDPATGTLLNLAACHEQLGKLATAFAEFRAAEVAATRDRRPDRIAFAQKRAAQLAPRLSVLEVVVPAAVRVPNLTVFLDGVAQVLGSQGFESPVDPGGHQVEATAPGFLPFAQRVTAGVEGERLRVDVALSPLVIPAVAKGPVLEGPRNAPPLVVASQVTEPAGTPSSVHAVTYALAGGGVVSMAREW